MDRPMTAPESKTPRGHPTSPAEPLTKLRGAGVDIDVRRVGRVVVGLSVVTLAALVVIFSIAGVNNNSQINRLHHDGVPVTVTVTKCLGLIGGSGSNGAGYSCSGAFTLDGHRYTEGIPGIGFHALGSSVRAVVVPGDPALLSPVSILATEHASWRVFILPGVLLIALVLLIGAILSWRRRHESAPLSPDHQPDPPDHQH
jgi:hypothetical protein